MKKLGILGAMAMSGILGGFSTVVQPSPFERELQQFGYQRTPSGKPGPAGRPGAKANRAKKKAVRKAKAKSRKK